MSGFSTHDLNIFGNVGIGFGVGHLLPVVVMHCATISETNKIVGKLKSPQPGKMRHVHNYVKHVKSSNSAISFLMASSAVYMTIGVIAKIARRNALDREREQAYN